MAFKKTFYPKKKKANRGPPSDAPVRVRTPRGTEVFGIILAKLGGSRLSVECKDGKERMCRIPGRMRKKVWVNENDVVLVQPWPIEGEKKGDIIWRYNPIQVRMLKAKGLI